jgi:hypothetical protein
MDRTVLQIELALELPNNFENYDATTQELIVQYLRQLNIIEKKAYSIGKQHLGSSFNLVRSNGFLNWKKGKH